MPPVFGPVSPSPTRLWSCADPKQQQRPRRRTARTATLPRRPGIPRSRPPHPTRQKSFWSIMASIAAKASSSVAATTTPLPAARPSAFTTIGAPRRRTKVTRRVGILEPLPQRRRDTGGIGDFLGEGLAALKLCRRPSRATARDACRLHGIGDPGDQRCLRSRNHQIDRVVLGERHQRRNVEHADRPHTRRPPRCRGCRARNTASSTADCRKWPSTTRAPARPIRRPAPSSLSPVNHVRFHAPTP